MDLEVEQPLYPTRRDWLDTPLAQLVTLDRATVVLLVLLLLTALSRFWDLGTRALHHDESLHAVYSYYLYERGEYNHQPLMHGPVLFHLTALSYWLFGATDTTARLVPALLGVLLAWLPWKYRSWLGVKGALVACALVLISPSLLYYSRFIREDIFAITWTAIIVYGLWKYLEGGESFHLHLMAAGWALLFSQKELSYLIAFVFWTFLALVLLLRVVGRLGPKVALRQSREWHLLVLLGALFLPLAAPVPLFALHLHPGSLEQDTSIYNFASNWSSTFNLQAYGLLFVLFGLGSALASYLWEARKFLTAAAIFWGIFILFHTTFFTNLFGFGSGAIGALGYWIEQQEVARGGQPWYYYLMLLPLYEFLPLLLGLGGGGWLLLRRRHGRIAPVANSDSPHLDARALWPFFNLWWFVLTFVLLSIAGEKMPWLLVHLAFPIAVLAGWAMGRFLDGVAWGAIRSREGLGFAALFLIALFAFLSICWMIASNQLAFRGSDEAGFLTTTRWLVTLLVLGGVGWVALGLSDRLGGHTARQVAILAVTALLAVATVRYAVIAAYINSDTPNEPLIFVQTSPSVTMVAHDIQAISERIAGGKNIKVAYDSFNSWPFDWYLRDYPNRVFYGSAPSDAIRDAAIVLVGRDNEDSIKPLVAGYIRHEYPLRWWFPEDYKDLTHRYTQVADPTNPNQTTAQIEFLEPTNENPGNVLANLAVLARQPSYRDDFWDFVRDRVVKQPLGGQNFVVYIKPEVAAQVWQYGVDVALPTTADPNAQAPTDGQPAPAAAYADITVQLPASEMVGQGSGLLSPKNVAVLRDGTLAVADSGNHRIRLVKPDGTLVREIGSFGAGQGQFNEPWGIAAAPDGTFYVADTWNHRVQHLDAQGKVLHVWGSYGDAGAASPAGTFWGPRAVAVDEEGNVYVTDTGNKRVQKFDPTGKFLLQFGSEGSGPGQFSEPVGIAVAPDGTLYVADTWNHRVQSFTPEGEPLQQVTVGTWAGQSVMNKPYIAASDERIWITDPESARIVELDVEGKPLRVWGQPGSDASSLKLPIGLAFDGETLWVADSENGRIVGYPTE